jgi:hypothetical protein
MIRSHDVELPEVSGTRLFRGDVTLKTGFTLTGAKTEVGALPKKRNLGVIHSEMSESFI